MKRLPSNKSSILFCAALLGSGCLGSVDIGDYPAAVNDIAQDDSAATLGVNESFIRAEIAAHHAFDEVDEDPAAEGLILAPEVVTGYVGEMLIVEVVLSNPDLGELRPASLPEEVIFEAWAGGASVEWVPEPRHIGQHDFVFLMVDGDDPDLVLAQKTILVSVLPRFSLVEYGF